MILTIPSEIIVYNRNPDLRVTILPGVGGNPVLYINNKYYLWYSGSRVSWGDTRQIGLATSDDGIHWNKYDDPTTTSTLYSDSDPVLMPGGPGAGKLVESPTVIHEGDSLRMWFSGYTGSLWGIVHATAPFDSLSTGLSEIKYAVVPDDYLLFQNYPNPFNSTTTISYQLNTQS